MRRLSHEGACYKVVVCYEVESKKNDYRQTREKR